MVLLLLVLLYLCYYYVSHEFHKKCVDPWLKIKQNCPMCKCSITKAPSPLPHADQSNVTEGHSGRGASEGSDDLNMFNFGREEAAGEGMIDLGHEEADEGRIDPRSSYASQDTDSSSDTQASDSPLLVTEGADEPGVAVLPYSPQVEVNLECVLPPPTVTGVDP